MLTVQPLEDLPLNDAPGLESEFRDAFAGPDPRRLPALLRWRQVVADALSGTLRVLAGFGGTDLPPRVGGVVALGDGDDPGQCRAPSGA
jgi:hypothetical protein